MEPVTRRGLLGRAGLLGSLLAVGTEDPPALSSEGPPEDRRKFKVVVTGGHPGDPEYGCGGTIACYAELGHDVVLLYLNDGERPGKPPGGVRGAGRRGREGLRNPRRPPLVRGAGGRRSGR